MNVPKSSPFSRGGIASAGLILLVLLLQRAQGFLSPALPTRGHAAHAAYPRRGATTMKHGPRNVQEVWDNHYAAFSGKNLEKILLDYDDDSVITTYNQTTDTKGVFEGVEGARQLFGGLFGAMVDQSDLAAPMIQVSEDSKMIFFVWRNPASGFLDATDTFLLNGRTKKIYRQNVAYKTA